MPPEKEHLPYRPQFLRNEPGLLDFLYNAWCKAGKLFSATTPQSSERREPSWDSFDPK